MACANYMLTSDIVIKIYDIIYSRIADEKVDDMRYEIEKTYKTLEHLYFELVLKSKLDEEEGKSVYSLDERKKSTD